jgi:hypothetical protein
MRDIWYLLGKPDSSFLTEGIKVNLTLPNRRQLVVPIVGVNRKWSLFAAQGPSYGGQRQWQAIVVGNRVATVSEIEESGGEFSKLWPSSIGIESSRKALDLWNSLSVSKALSV